MFISGRVSQNCAHVSDIIPCTGKDASSAFASIGHSQDAVDLRETYLIGALESTTAPLTRTPPQGSTVLEAESTTAPPLPRDPEQEAESAATLRGQK